MTNTAVQPNITNREYQVIYTSRLNCFPTVAYYGTEEEAFEVATYSMRTMGYLRATGYLGDFVLFQLGEPLPVDEDADYNEAREYAHLMAPVPGRFVEAY